HEIRGLRVFQNVVKNTAWDAIQIGCATDDIEVYNNTAENFGTENKTGQWSGIQVGEGSGGLYYNNLIKHGKGQGLNILGLGEATFYNNVIFDVERNGIFSDLRGTGPFGSGYKIINNTVVSPGIDGIVVYAKDVTKNVVINNLVVDPGSYGNYGSNTAKAFLNVGAAAPIEQSNNYFAETTGDARFQAAGSGDFRLLTDSPAKDAGKDVSGHSITTDFLGTARPKGAGYDIGAFEF
ncbi:MAG TPA: right-handed parallel beta-helix repeat-containing protein, partial [Ohtaekwangia sp.]|nr:right-handed parallel beta-helix repeat-containing protein [Ohtaekwangia sp.]